MNDSLISIIIPTYNSEKFLQSCLQSITDQTYTPIEILIVDNYSSDCTIEIAKEFNVRIIQYRAKIAESRNVGARAAKGDAFLSVDSDMCLTPNVVKQCVESGFDAVVIPEVSVGKGFWAKCRAIEKKCYFKDRLIEGIRFMKSDIFWEIGGYDPILELGEDWDITVRMARGKTRIGRIEAILKHQEGNLRLKDALLKKYRYGKSVKLYRDKHPELAKKQLRLIRPAFIRNWRILLREPSHAVGLCILKTCEFMAGWLGSKTR